MDFTTYLNAWLKSEITQGRIMIGLGILGLVALYGILRSQHELLRGTIVPFSLLLLVLIGYGSYILVSRPAHARASTARYEAAPSEAIATERAKHVNDNRAGKTLLRYVYPLLILLGGGALLFLGSPHYRGVAIGVIFLAAAAYVIDYGFVSRSDAFIAFLDTLRN